MKFNSKNSFKSLDTLNSYGKIYKYFNLKTAEKNGLEGISKLPKSLTPKQKLFNDKDLEEFKKLGWTGPPSLKTLNKNKRKKRKK